MDLTTIPLGLALIIAFSAGLVSFISPCVLPLVPAYVSYMGGRVTHKVATQVHVSGGQAALAPLSLSARFSTFAHGVAFVVGFTFVFVAFGLLATAFIGAIGASIVTITDILGRVGGVIIIFFGLHFMGVIPRLIARLHENRALISSPFSTLAVAVIGSALILWGFVEITLALPVLAVFILWLVLGGAYTNPEAFWLRMLNTVEAALYSDTRRQMRAHGSEGLLGSAFMGVVFSAGWTPCVGPVYGAALNLAVSGTGADIAQAGILLTAYSLGLGIPFLLTTLLLDSAQGVLRRLQRHMGRIELFSGALLILIGIIVATGQLQSLSQSFSSGELGLFSVQLEEGVVDLFLGPEENAAEENSSPNAQAAPTESAMDSLGAIDALAADEGPVVGLEVGNQAPNFKTTLDSGQAIQLSDLRGQVVLLNFWATWCGPCRLEMPEFEAAYQAHAEKGFTILAINNQESVEDVLGFREELGLTFPMLMDEEGTIQKQYRIGAYPSTYLLDRDGIIIARHLGPLVASQIQELVEGALAS